MSTTIDQAFIKQYEADVHVSYQRKGSKLRGTVRTVNNVNGSSVQFPKAGKGTAVQKTRHGVITPMNQDHSFVTATLEDWYAGDWIDKLDLLKTNIDERQIMVDAGAYALGRTTDQMIIDQLAQTTTTVGDYSTGFTKVIASQAIEAMNDADVPDDGQRYGVLSSHAWEEFCNIDEASSMDYVGDQYPWLKGTQARMWRGVVWMQHSGLPLADTDNRDCYLYHRTALGHAIGSEIMSDFDWQGDRAAWFVNNMMSMAAILIDTAGVIEMRVDDNTAIS